MANELYNTSLFSDGSLKSYYRLEGNSNDAKGANNGSDANVSYSSGNGKFNQGAGFNGSSSVITLPAMTLGSNFTLNFWVNLNTSGNFMYNNRNGQSASFKWFDFAITNSQASLETSGGGGGGTFDYLTWSTSALNDNNFHLVSLVFSSNTSVSLYIDGSLVSTKSRNNSTIDGAASYYINKYFDGASNYYYASNVDDVSIFTRALSSTEINHLYTGDFSSSPSRSISPSSSISSSISPSASISLSPSASVSPSSSTSSSPSSSNSPSVSPSPSKGYQNYSRGAYASLPTNDNDLATIYTDQEEVTVSVKDGNRVAQTGMQQYMIHEFKEFIGNNTTCQLEWFGRTSQAPTLSPVNLQVYNYNTSTWDTVATNNTSAPDTDFTLLFVIPDMTNYKHNSMISCRVAQLGL